MHTARSSTAPAGRPGWGARTCSPRSFCTVLRRGRPPPPPRGARPAPIGTGGALWVARLNLLASLILHVVAAVQLAARRVEARPVAYAAGRRPQVSTWASRSIRWGGGLILAFLIYHILHFTIGTAHPDFVEGDPYHNVATGFHNPLVVIVYLVAMVAVGLHLYHGVWSSGRSLGMSPPSPNPLRRTVAVLLAVLVWLGFTLIPLAVYAGVVR